MSAIVVSLVIYTQILYIYVIPESFFYLVCVSAAEERHGCRFWRGSAEETAWGGRLVQPSSLPIHLHPGPGSQDPRPAPTAQKLRHTHTSTKTELKLLPSIKTGNSRKFLSTAVYFFWQHDSFLRTRSSFVQVMLDVKTHGKFCVISPNYVWLTLCKEQSSKKWQNVTRWTHLWNFYSSHLFFVFLCLLWK